MKKWLPYILLLVAFIFFFNGDVEAQCSQCKLLAEQSGDSIDDSILDNNNGNNINSAILYIMASPYILLAILGITFRKRIKAFFKSKMG
ncbi:hypothetical protein [Brumimicrobium aurantiacum]|uniref:Uncharacterized protein n=1 Tax=Brumimicrobium aurantiacum TaxID=1737063 RepID=A0A3E1F1L6_9FLAO|nr:hypothetical protein [Brumimicrobium aurantiacum]RFC55721.1 hypothetical protein DXU93_01945 [Brumimicrobium aurantiacum]